MAAQALALQRHIDNVTGFAKAFAANTLRADKLPDSGLYAQDLNVWLAQVDAATTMYQWDAAAKFSIAPLIIDSVVWADLVPLLPAANPTWEHVVQGLRILRGTPVGGVAYLHQLDPARQQPDESVQFFAPRFSRLCMLAQQDLDERRLLV